MPVDLTKLDRESLRLALARAESAAARALELLEGGEVAPLETVDDVGRVLLRIHRCGEAMGEAAVALEGVLDVVALADPGTARVMRESLQ